MTDDHRPDWLACKFEENRAHLKTVALRILGAAGDADDAVQEAWLRLNRSAFGEIENLGGWLTTVVARVCLDMLRARKVRSEEPLDEGSADRSGDDEGGPERAALLADAMGPALVALLETLGPAERVAFVLHDVFDLSFEEIAPIVDRSPSAARQLASRARRRLRGGARDDPRRTPGESDRRQELVAAFLAASRAGDLAALIRVLDPDVSLRADETAVKVALANRAKGAPQFAREMRGAAAIAELFKGRATGARLALVDGAPGAAWIHEGHARVAFLFAIDSQSDRISGIEVVMQPEALRARSITALE